MLPSKKRKQATIKELIHMRGYARQKNDFLLLALIKDELKRRGAEQGKQ